MGDDILQSHGGVVGQTHGNADSSSRFGCADLSIGMRQCLHGRWGETKGEGDFGSKDGGAGIETSEVPENPGSDLVAIVGGFVLPQPKRRCQ